MNEFPPSIDPKLSTLTSVILGFALIGDYSANEQRAIGNWLIGVGQVLITNSTFQIMIEDRIEGNDININSASFKCGGSPYPPNSKHNFYQGSPFSNVDMKNIFHDIDLNNIREVLIKMQKELDELAKRY